LLTKPKRKAEVECNEEDENDCRRKQAALNYEREFIFASWEVSSNTQDYVAVSKQIVKFCKRVSAHNARCPSYKVLPLSGLLRSR